MDFSPSVGFQTEKSKWIKYLTSRVTCEMPVERTQSHLLTFCCVLTIFWASQVPESCSDRLFLFRQNRRKKKKHDRRRKQTSQSFVLASSFQCDSYFVWSYYLGIGLHSTWFTLDTVFTQPMATAWPSQPTNQRQCWRRCISVSVTSYTGNAILIKWNTVQNKSWHQILLFVVNM